MPVAYGGDLLEHGQSLHYDFVAKLDAWKMINVHGEEQGKIMEEGGYNVVHFVVVA